MAAQTTLVVIRMENGRKKPRRVPVLITLGDRLEQLRGKTPLKVISKRLAAIDAPLTFSTLAQYERGTVMSPDPAVLWGLAMIYKVPLEELLTLLRTDRKNLVVDGKNRTDDTNDRLKSDDTRPLHVVEGDSERQRRPAQIVIASGANDPIPRRAVRQAEWEKRLDAIATRFDDTTNQLVQFGAQLADILAKLEIRGQTASPGAESSARDRSDQQSG